MEEEIISLAVLDAKPGKEDQLLNILREFYSFMRAKGYSHDTLHRDTSRPGRFLHLRYWASPQMRAEAQADPEVHRYWLRLPELCDVPIVYESLEKVVET
ncbi:MAG TPA: antibiotic biosynthesis monooxygenase [Terriglobales bacterium]|nr:antibiotic biosynthesis monooxygenase [Terriglobales bacterium]